MTLARDPEHMSRRVVEMREMAAAVKDAGVRTVMFNWPPTTTGWQLAPLREHVATWHRARSSHRRRLWATCQIVLKNGTTYA